MNNPKRILHVINVSFVLQHFLGNQFGYFQKRGLKFYVACTPSDFFYKYAKKKDFIPIGINIFRAIKPFSDIEAIYKLVKHIKKENIEIVVGHTPKGGMIAMLAAFVAGVDKRIYFRHGIMYETSTGFKRLLLKSIEKLTAACATKIVCVSSSVMEFSINEKLNDPKKSILLNKGTCNGVDVGYFSKNNLETSFMEDLKKSLEIKKQDFVIGYVGRLVKDKGINELIDAWKIVLNQEKNLKLLLVGPFEERDGLSDKVKQYIISEPSIIYTDLVEKAQPYYDLMNVFILPSYREGFPTVTLEASAMSLPIITTKATGCKDSIRENQTGVFTAIDAANIAKKILFYKQNPSIARRHGQNGRKFVTENFDQKIIWKEIEEKIFEL